MNAALYFELVDAVTKIDGSAKLRVVTDRIAATPMHPLCDLFLAIRSDEVALIQQMHITAAHAICHLVEQELFGAGRS